MPTEPDRNWLLHRQGIHSGIFNAVPLTIKIHDWFCPQDAHQLNLLFDATTSIVKVLSKCDVFGFISADSNSKPKSSSTEDIERRGLLSGQHSLSLREDQDAGDEGDALGDACPIAYK